MVSSGICGGWRGCGSFFGSGRGERWMERWGLGWRLFHYRLSRLVEMEGPGRWRCGLGTAPIGDFAFGIDVVTQQCDTRRSSR